MSIEAISRVLEQSEATGGARLVLIALADYAHADGSNAFPAIASLAKKARLSERAVQYALRNLRAAGEIERTGTTSHGVAIYRVTPGGAIGAGANAAGCKTPQLGVQKAAESDAQIAPDPSKDEPSYPSGARARAKVVSLPRKRRDTRDLSRFKGLSG